MRRAYLFLYDQSVGARQHVKKIIDSMPSVITWRFDMPNCIYVISKESASELAKEFEGVHGTQGRFMFVEVTGTRQGRMPEKTWYLLRHMRHLPKED